MRRPSSFGVTASRGRNASEKQFQIEGRGRKVRVFLRDRFALFRQSDVTAERAMRKRIQETVRRTGTTTDRAPATMEEADFHASGLTSRSKLRLRAMQRPLASDNASVFIAIGISDHDLLHKNAWATIALRMEHETVPRDGLLDELLEHLRSPLQIIGCFKKRHHGK